LVQCTWCFFLQIIKNTFPRPQQAAAPAFLFFRLVGCNNNNQPDVSPVSSVAKTEYTSEIDQMEKEEGVTFFKKDVLLKSADGKSEVLMRFASRVKSDLETYLTMHEFKLSPIFTKATTKAPVAGESDNKDNNKLQVQPTNTGKAINIMSEQLSSKLEAGAIGYGIDTRNVPIAERPNMRISAEADYYIEIYSDRRPDRYKMEVYSEHVWLNMRYREGWANPNWFNVYNGYPNVWRQIFAKKVYSGNGWDGTWTMTKYEIDVAAAFNPYKVLTKVHYFQTISPNYTQNFFY
jgi:hypothetical protein